MESNIWIYWTILKKRFWVILLLVAVTMGVILTRAWTTPPTYRSATVLQVIPLEPEEVTLYTRLNTVSSADTIDLIFYQFSSLVRSARIAQRTIAETGVAVMVDELVNKIAVERDPAGDLVTVAVTAATPEDAEKLVRQQVSLALVEFRESRARTAEASGKFLELELMQADRDLADARAAVLDFKLQNSVEYLDRETVAQQEAIRAFRSQKVGADLALKRLNAVIAELGKQLKVAETKLAAAEADTADAAFWRMRVEDLNQQIASRQVDVVGQQVEAEAAVTALSQAETDLARFIRLSGEYQTLQDAVGERQASRDFLAGKEREARIKQSQIRSIGYLQIIGEPSMPRSQVQTQTIRIVVLGGLLSLIAGLVLIFVIELFDRGLRAASSPTEDPTHVNHAAQDLEG